MVFTILILVGILLVVAGVVALFKLQGGDGDTEFSWGSVKFSTKHPALAVVVLGILCISAPFVVPKQAPKASELPEEVVTGYLDLVAAYNARDKAKYYAHYAEPMECFYSSANAAIAASRTELTSHLQVSRTDLSALDVQPERIELCDRGYWLAKGTRLQQHHKIIVMKKIANVWRVVIETGSDQNRCYSSPYASRC